MTGHEDARFRAVARRLSVKKLAPLTPQEWAMVTDGKPPREAEDVAEDVIELRRTFTKARTFGVLHDLTVQRLTVPEPPPWWRLYCYRVGEPFEPMRAEVRASLGLDAPLDGLEVALIQASLVGGAPTRHGDRFWVLNQRASQIAEKTGARKLDVVAFLLADVVLGLPWLEVGTVRRGQGVGFELSVGSAAVSPAEVAAAYARAVAESGAPVPEGTGQESATVDLIIAYADAIKRYPAKRGRGNTGVKQRRLEALPEDVRRHFGDDADGVDKRYWAKVRALPEYLKPGKGGEPE